MAWFRDSWTSTIWLRSWMWTASALRRWSSAEIRPLSAARCGNAGLMVRAWDRTTSPSPYKTMETRARGVTRSGSRSPIRTGQTKAARSPRATSSRIPGIAETITTIANKEKTDETTHDFNETECSFTHDHPAAGIRLRPGYAEPDRLRSG